MQPIRPVVWVPDSPVSLVPGHVRMIDQTLLPVELRYIDTVSTETIWQAIRTLQVRGAPAIGIAAAMGVAAAAQEHRHTDLAGVKAAVERAADYLATSRPTAVNLFWALERMRSTARAIPNNVTPANASEQLVREAVAIRDEDAAMCRAIGRHGVALLHDDITVLTHCNAGALATAEFGTALAPIYTAHERGWRISVYSDETRPLLQGSRLTAWELTQAGIPTTVICDNMAAQVMKEQRVQAVLVGADRIAANGDAANKIGTYGVALLARAHNIPFYVLAPTSTLDPKTPDGSAIPIEERMAEEVIHGFGRITAPETVHVYSPAFDVTPAELITAIVCETGVLKPDYRKSIAAAVKASKCHQF